MMRKLNVVVACVERARFMPDFPDVVFPPVAVAKSQFSPMRPMTPAIVGVGAAASPQTAKITSGVMNVTSTCEACALPTVVGTNVIFAGRYGFGVRLLPI